MIDSARQDAALLLKREAQTISARAAHDLAQTWAEQLSVAGFAREAQTTGSDLSGAQQPSRDEVVAMMQGGYERLGAVVALSLLVDEPGLIADDLLWLTRLFEARNMNARDPDWLDSILKAYRGACASTLPEQVCAQVDAVIARAIVQLPPQEGTG